ncbi:MAG: hypothetical protein KJ645_13630, partial [Planctomycetes bacterium]|nr:hypothetical protein [Planctomycetota bacterium]
RSDREFFRILDGPLSRSWRFFRSSQLFCLCEGMIAFAAREIGDIVTDKKHAVNRYLYYPRFPTCAPETMRNDENAFIEHMAKIHEACKEHRIPFVILIPFASPKIKSRNPLESDYYKRMTRLRTVLIDWARKNRIPFLDPKQVFRSSQIPLEELLVDFCHPSGQGHALIAQRLLKLFEVYKGLYAPR